MGLIIPRTTPAVHSVSWREELANPVTGIEELLALTGNSAHLEKVQAANIRGFPLRVPRPFVSRIIPGDWHDPLLRQILPDPDETAPQPGFSSDPLHEALSNPQQGIIQKYHGRVLLMLSSTCPINCRYCFRRHFPYKDNRIGRDEWQGILDHIRKDTSISEVIYSGGEPLIQSDRRLAQLIRDLDGIRHLKRLRIHTRLPVVIPQRVTTELVDWLTSTSLQPVLVLHTNHANELDDSVSQALGPLQKANITLLNQSVLLRGVNDSLTALQNLSERLFELGVLPYYLHTLDRVQGAAHFSISAAKTAHLFDQLRNALPGYLVPRLVSEIAGQGSKSAFLSVKGL